MKKLRTNGIRTAEAEPDPYPSPYLVYISCQSA